MITEIPPEPARIARLPHDRHGRPIPFFAAVINGEPDFRVIAPGRPELCHTRRLCWVCGGQLTRHTCFPLGPMCTITRTVSEPPSHIECAEFAARTCPFLTHPRMRRNEKNLPEHIHEAPGHPIARNPGCVALWITTTHTAFQAPGGTLYRVGPPSTVTWYTEGRLATRAEVEESIASGLPTLEAAARQDGPAAIAQLKSMILATRAYLPA